MPKVTGGLPAGKHSGLDELPSPRFEVPRVLPERTIAGAEELMDQALQHLTGLRWN